MQHCGHGTQSPACGRDAAQGCFHSHPAKRLKLRPQRVSSRAAGDKARSVVCSAHSAPQLHAAAVAERPIEAPSQAIPVQQLTSSKSPDLLRIRHSVSHLQWQPLDQSLLDDDDVPKSFVHGRDVPRNSHGKHITGNHGSIRWSHAYPGIARPPQATPCVCIKLHRQYCPGLSSYRSPYRMFEQHGQHGSLQQPCSRIICRICSSLKGLLAAVGLCHREGGGGGTTDTCCCALALGITIRSQSIQKAKMNAQWGSLFVRWPHISISRGRPASTDTRGSRCKSPSHYHQGL